MRPKEWRIAFLNPQGNFDAHDHYWTQHPDFGGQLVYVKELACAMSQMGIRADIITRRMTDPDWPVFGDPLDRYEGFEGVRIIRIPCGPPHFLPKELLWPHLEAWSKRIAQFYEQEGSYPDFWTGHYGDGGISAAFLCSHTSIPFSFTGHSLGAQKIDKLGLSDHPDDKVYRQFRFSLRLAAERTAMRYASSIMVSTTMEQNEQYAHPLYHGWVDSYDDSKFAVIPPGVNLSIFHPTLSKKDEEAVKTPIPLDRPLIILSSRIDPKKNHLSVIKAYAASSWLKRNARLLIVVRGYSNLMEQYRKMPSPDRELVEQWIEVIREEGLEDSVLFADISDQSMLASLYRLAGRHRSVFCSTPLYEPFGLTVIEAMGCGLPVVATQNGGPSEILRDRDTRFGILVDPTDISDISQGLEQVLREGPLYEELVQKGIQRVNDRYTWRSTAQGYVERIRIIKEAEISQRPNLRPFQQALTDFE